MSVKLNLIQVSPYQYISGGSFYLSIPLFIHIYLALFISVNDFSIIMLLQYLKNTEEQCSMKKKMRSLELEKESSEYASKIKAICLRFKIWMNLWKIFSHYLRHAKESSCSYKSITPTGHWKFKMMRLQWRLNSWTL